MKTMLRMTAIVCLLLATGIAGRRLEAGSAAPASNRLERVSLANDGSQSNDYSVGASISADGRYVAFESTATNLMGFGSDHNSDDPDVFVRDRLLQQTEIISVSSMEIQGNYGSSRPSISSDGRYVAFDSDADNLVSGDDNHFYRDIFVRDRQLTTTVIASLSEDGSQGDDDSYGPSISDNWMFVAFESRASLVDEDDDTYEQDIYVRIRIPFTEMISVTSDEVPLDLESFAPSISGDGRYVAFSSYATNVASSPPYYINIFVRDRVLDLTWLVSGAFGAASQGGNSHSGVPSISADGRYVTFTSGASDLTNHDANNSADIFVYDMIYRTLEVISVSSAGIAANGHSFSPSISSDGRYVAFVSLAANLVGDDTNGVADVFVRDRNLDTTVRISAGDAGQGNGSSIAPSISGDGRSVAFESEADNLVPGDTNGDVDVFVWERSEEFQTFLPFAICSAP